MKLKQAKQTKQAPPQIRELDGKQLAHATGGQNVTLDGVRDHSI